MVDKSDVPEENLSLVNQNNVQIEKTNDVAGMVSKSAVKEESVSLVHRDNEDIESAIDAAGHGRYNLMVLVTSCVITVGTVMEMLGYSLVVPAASCDLNLTLQQGGILKSISFAGFAFSIPWGYTADTIGRKRTILVSVGAGFIFSALSSFAINYYMMLILKFLASCFSTASLTLITTYLGESTCRKQRNRYIFIQNISSTGTDFVCYVLAYFILPLDFATPIPYIKVYRSWRLFSLVMSLPLGIGAVMLYFLNETPKFLIDKGNTDKTMDVLTRIYKVNHGNSKTCVYPVKSLLKIDVVEKVSFWESLILIFKPPLLWKSIQLFLLLAICCSTNNVFFMWFPTMANSFFTSDDMNTSFCQKIAANITPIHHDDVCTDNNSMNTIYSGMIFTLLFICLNIGAYVLANWRRTMILTFLLISCVSCITVNSITDPIASMVIFCMIQLTVLPLGSIYSYYVDVFPTSCRALATGLGMMVARYVCIGGVALVGTTVINHCLLTFYCWAAFIFSGIVAAIFLPKEEARKDNIS